MKIQKSKLILLFAIMISLSNQTTYRVPTTKEIYTIYDELHGKGIEVKPGDVFIYEKGIHELHQYLGDLSGTAENPIIITGEEGAIIKNGTWFASLSHFVFDGLEMSNPVGASLNVYASKNITVKNCYIHQAYNNGIKVTGWDIVVRNNTLVECNYMNINGTSHEMGGQSIGTEAADEDTKELSNNIIIENNYVIDSWGEGIDLLYCNNCIARNNTVKNAWSVFYYVDNSHNCIVENNIGYQTEEKFDHYKTQRANGMAIGMEAHGPWDCINITFRNNLIFNCGQGIVAYYERGHYEGIRVVHNTFFNTSEASFKFDRSDEPEKVKDNEVSNNLFCGRFGRIEDDFERSTWKVHSNVWVGKETYFHPLEDSDGFQNSSVTYDDRDCKGFLFNFTDKECHDPECYFPTKGDIIYKKGIRTSYSGDVDFYGERRDLNHPTIGFVENPKEEKNSGCHIKTSLYLAVLVLVILV